MARKLGIGQRTVKRGAVVRIREGRDGVLSNRRGIVMSAAPNSDYVRAYGPEFYVCEVFSEPGTALVVRDAVKSKDIARIKQLVEHATTISEKNVSMLQVVGRVKKIPQICTYAMKIE